MRGPRLHFKNDWADHTGKPRRGAIVCLANLQEPSVEILRATLETAPGEQEEVHVSEGYRNVKDTRDLHREGRAFDISTRRVPGHASMRLDAVMNDWAGRLRVRLGRNYQVIVHDTGSGLHIHIEFDP